MRISISFMPMVIGSTLSLVGSGRCSIVAATNVSVIIFEVDVVAEQKQTYW